MDSFYPVLTLLLLAALAFTIMRLRKVGHCLRELDRSLRARKPLLLDRENRLLDWQPLRRLHDSLNALIVEHQHTSKQELDYINTIDTTMSNLSEAVLILDEINRLVLANPAARSVFQIGSAEGVRLESFLEGSDFLNLVARTKKGESVTRQEIEFNRLGEATVFEVSGARVPATDSDGVMYLFVFHDITKLKQLEGMRKEFVANVSHELRTPVTIIKGFTDTLLDDHASLPPESVERFLQKIHRNVNRLNLLLEDLLTLSRLEGPKDMLKRTQFSLEQIIREVADGFHGKLDPQKQHLQFDLRSDADQVFVDPIKLSQVFQNLFDNSLRYARDFSQISVKTRREDDQVRVTVSDDGCGVGSEDLPLIFQRFYRVDKGRSRETGGTGLGLSIVKHIIQMHGGEVQAYLGEGGGLCIEFTLPLEAETARLQPALER